MYHPRLLNALTNTAGTVVTSAWALSGNVLRGIANQGANVIAHPGALKDGIVNSRIVGALVTGGGFAKNVYIYSGIGWLADNSGLSTVVKTVTVWGGVLFTSAVLYRWTSTIVWLATPITFIGGKLGGGAGAFVKDQAVDAGKAFGEALIQGVFWGAVALVNGGASAIGKGAVQVLTDSTWQTWGVVACSAAAYATYRFSGRVIDETISYYAAAAKEAISAPFSNIQMKKNIPLITPAFNLVAKGFRQIFPADPKANPILSPKVRAQLDQIVSGMKNQKKNRGYFQNIVLEGPPGTGKTMIAKKIAEDSGFNFIKMSGSDLAGYIAKGTHLSTLNRYMNYAKKSFHPTVLFIDEADTFVAKRETLGHGQKELLTQFLEHTGDPEFNKNVMIIMATNRAKCFDSAVNSRMDHSIHIGTPSRTQRAGIIQEHANIAFRGMSEIGRDGVLNASGIAAIAARTNHLTGRALQKLINSLLSVRSSSFDNKLTWDMVDDEVYRFVWKDRSSPDASRSWKVIEMTSDLWHFTLPWLCRRIFAMPEKVANRAWSVVKYPW